MNEWTLNEMDGQLEQFNSEGSVFMATIFDVADWFLSKEAMTPKKLCYFYKAWGLALYDEDLAETKVGPWRDARVGVKDGEVCTNQLDNEDIKRYYKRLHEAHQGE